MDSIIQVNFEVFHDNFECKCGNDFTSWGFYYCNDEGIEDISGGWKGHYICGICDQVYLLEGDWKHVQIQSYK